MAGNRYEMDMTSGPLLGNIIRFSLPLMLSGILQLLYNAADIIVVGRFAGSTALAAVGSTGSLTGLLVNLFMGLSVGTSVVVSRHFGAGRHKDVSQSVHTSVAASLICGVFVGVMGMTLARPLLELMGTPEDVIDLAVLYLTIYFAGMPANLLYNFCAAVLRAVGDTKRPLYYLTAAGLVNVALNLVFVIGFHMSVAGVALATIISQVISAVLVVLCLIRTEGSIHLDVRSIRIYKDKMIDIIRVGLPAGLQSSLFAISNTLIQSSVNSFGSEVMAGNTAAANLEGFVYTAMNSVYQAAMTFTSQNYGARKSERLGRIMVTCLAVVMVIGIVMGEGVYLLRKPLLGIYSTDPFVVEWGSLRLGIISTTYFLCGLMDVLVGGLRGMGYSFVPMVVSLMGACVLRVCWIYTIFAANHTLVTLYLSYPVSWTVTAAVHAVCFIIGKRKVTQKLEALRAAEG